MRSDFPAADAIVSNYFGRGGQPAICYGIVADGALVHAAGFGARALGGPPPDAGTVFRIASMSKSFTASAVLLLRDEGLLALEDPAEKYVPELAGWPPATPDSDRVTIRHLLTMTAGFPTDDPWGDRQQGLPLAEFGDLLAGGVSVNWAPGTRFEYSNLGYAILGRVIAAASGTEYSAFVRTRLLVPLGLARTGFAAAEFDAAGLATGYRRGMGGWEELPFDPYGAFAPMGGVFSCVADLARWVAGFAAAFPPGAVVDPGGRPPGAPRLRLDGARAPGELPSGTPRLRLDGALAAGELPPGGHPLRAASRREMQLPQAVTGWRAPDRLPGGGAVGPAYYGFGLFVDEDAGAGRVVSHSGGYPGFGSNMRWHLASGLGVIALGNATYAAMSALTAAVLEAVRPRSAASHIALAPVASESASAAPPAPPAPPGQPWPQTVAAREQVNRLLHSWDDAAADALFTENVALDSPYQERRRTLALIRERIGDFAPSAARPAESDTPAHCRWWLAGERGTVQVQIQLNPQRPPRVQSLTLAVPPAAGSPLARALQSLLAWMNDGATQWPSSVPVAPGADARLLGRRLRMAAVWAGRAVAGAYRAGDGAASVSVELAGEDATIVLSLLVNPATGELRQADITL
ncbi:serine hydrolase domain-containing protein [Trebonia sp.]|uniref:serine hydrolase domain-containing protein n=1 Tax=Trebonia sp. TaxID=2767075 RepID=UPI002603EDCB|nr:serine hydrolase domain-containing protein [Trebonia sp.]